jgi:hypothetical protein
MVREQRFFDRLNVVGKVLYDSVGSDAMVAAEL